MKIKTEDYDFCNNCNCVHATKDANSPVVAFTSPAINGICGKNFNVEDAVGILNEIRKSPKYDNTVHDEYSTMADILFWKSVPYFGVDNDLSDADKCILATETIISLAVNFYQENTEFVHKVMDAYDSAQKENA